MSLIQLLEAIEVERAAIDESIGRLHRMEVRALMMIKEDGNGASNLVKLFGNARRTADTFEEAFKPVKGIVETLKLKEIPEAFEREEVRTQTTTWGDRVGLTTRVMASIKADMREKAYGWLRSNGHEDLIVETVNASTLAAFAKSMMAEGMDLPEEIFNVAVRQEATLTKGKVK